MPDSTTPPYKWQAFQFICTIKPIKLIISNQPTFKTLVTSILANPKLAMASTQHFVILAIILAIFAPSILATDYIVGDGKGWTINFDYQAWAQGKMFYVGDILVFNYPQGVHNVYKVNGTGFQECAVPAGVMPLTSGNDVINLATPGRKWYICGVARHCSVGQKLFITVMPSMAPSPSPLSASSAVPSPSPTARCS
uniref:stellacyanin-like n=1 Tax=Fragaria vesca subsp. vesca TaxID=101020 RepID=UPI0005CA4E7F|nr:PREDICTED: stellacyanin-like [Fragaria vesca subsp. vesca]